MKIPKVTVITPTYNRAKFLSETIESVLRQSYKDFEYYILDDGSIDNTKEIVKPYLNDKRVKYLYHDNCGEAETVNWGWKLAKGEYFTQVNSDDPILPGLFSEMVKVLDNKKNIVVAYPNFYFIDENGKVIKNDKNTKWNFFQALSDFSCYAASAGTFIRKTSFLNWEKIRDKRFKHINDIYMFWNMALNGDFIHIDKFLANWRVHSGSISHERYKAIPEIKIWFKEYFSRKDISKEVLQCKIKTEESIYKYFISLIESSNLEDKIKTINIYKKKLGLKCYKFKNLQVGDNDLIGNKFNGHNLHKYLRERKIDSSHLVWKKESDDLNTFEIAFDLDNRSNVRDNIINLQKRYSLNSICNSFVYDILYSRLFLDSDIVHFHLIHNNIFDINLLPIISRLKPIIWTIHDPWVVGGHCTYHFDCQRWLKKCGNCPYLSVPFVLDKDNSALNYEIKSTVIKNSNFDVIVASKWMKNIIKKSDSFRDKNIHLIPFGIDHNIFKPLNKIKIRNKFNIPLDSIVITFRCDYSKFKGMEYVEYVLDNLKTNKKIFLLLLANDFKEKRFKYKYINFGWINDDNLLSEIYNASDIFLMPSIMEAFGMMAIEAMSCGVLPIVLDGTALPDTVNSKSCGVSSKQDKNEYLKTVQFYIDNKIERINRSKLCLEYAKKHYNKKLYLDKIVRVYENSQKSFNINKNDLFLLSQLKANMSLEPGCTERINSVGIKIIKSLVPKHKRKIYLDYFLVSFYKVDKIFPKRFRLYVKSKITNIEIVKKYLIKS